MEAGDVPVLDEATEFRDNTEFSKLSKPLDGQNAWIVQLEFLSFVDSSFLAVHLAPMTTVMGRSVVSFMLRNTR